MNMPFYVAPEQVMKDRADYARKGIARGRSLVGFRFDKGVAICAENTSSTLRRSARSTTGSLRWVGNTTSLINSASPVFVTPI